MECVTKPTLQTLPPYSHLYLALFDVWKKNVLHSCHKLNCTGKGKHTCCALLKRWISSRNKTVFLKHGQCKWMKGRHTSYFPVSASNPFASSNTARTSLIPDEVALSSLNMQFTSFANNLDSVVFPQLCILEHEWYQSHMRNLPRRPPKYDAAQLPIFDHVHQERVRPSKMPLSNEIA